MLSDGISRSASIARGDEPSGFSFEASLTTRSRPYRRRTSSIGVPGTYGGTSRIAARTRRSKGCMPIPSLFFHERHAPAQIIREASDVVGGDGAFVGLARSGAISVETAGIAQLHPSARIQSRRGSFEEGARLGRLPSVQEQPRAKLHVVSIEAVADRIERQTRLAALRSPDRDPRFGDSTIVLADERSSLDGEPASGAGRIALLGSIVSALDDSFGQLVRRRIGPTRQLAGHDGAQYRRRAITPDDEILVGPRRHRLEEIGARKNEAGTVKRVDHPDVAIVDADDDAKVRRAIFQARRSADDHRPALRERPFEERQAGIDGAGKDDMLDVEP